MGIQPFGSRARVRWCGGRPDQSDPGKRDPGAESTTHEAAPSKWEHPRPRGRRVGGEVPSADTSPPWLTQGGTGPDQRAAAMRRRGGAGRAPSSAGDDRSPTVSPPCPSPPVTGSTMSNIDVAVETIHVDGPAQPDRGGPT